MKTKFHFFQKALILSAFLVSMAILPLSAKTFIINHDTRPSTLDPHTGTPGTDHDYFKQMFEPLVEIDTNGNPIPSLAVSWESKDLKTWTFHLRKGVSFHDGTPFNAAAVKFNIERIQDPATKSKVRGTALKIKKLEIVDDYTIRLTLGAPNVDFPLTMQDRPGMMVSPAAAKKYGKDFGRNPVGTGPFVFQSWKISDSVIMKRNPNYWAKERVFLDEVIFKIVPDKNVSVMNIKAGKADLMLNVPPEHIMRLKADPKLKVYRRSGLNFEAVYLRMFASPPFNKKEVRLAFAHAIDKVAISKALYFGMAEPANGLFPKGFWAHDPNLPDFSRANVAKARELLRKAGYPNGFDVVYTTIPAFPFNKIAQIIKQQAAKADIRITINMVGLGQAIKSTVLNKIPILGLGWSGRIATDATFQSLIHSAGSYNNKNYVNPTVDGLLAEGRATVDVAKRKATYSKVQRIISDEMPIVPLIHTQTACAARKSITGIKYHIDIKLRLLDVKAN